MEVFDLSCEISNRTGGAFICYDQLITYFKDKKVIDGDNNPTNKMFVRCLKTSTSENHYDLAIFGIINNLIEQIRLWDLLEDAAPATYPSIELRERITEFSIGADCTSFNGDDIQEELKSLTSIKKLYIRLNADKISVQVLQIYLRQPKIVEIDVDSHALGKKLIGIIFSEGSDMKRDGMVLYVGGDKITIDHKNATFLIEFGVNTEDVLDLELFAAAEGFSFKLDVPRMANFPDRKAKKMQLRYMSAKWTRFQKLLKDSNLYNANVIQNEDAFKAAGMSSYKPNDIRWSTNFELDADAEGEDVEDSSIL